MGGCCCSSRKPPLAGTPIYYYCPPTLEDHGRVRSRHDVSSAFTAGLLVDVSLETSIPDTFRAPVPLPYDMLLGRPQSTDSESMRERISGSSFNRISGSSFNTLSTFEDLEEADCKTQADSLILSPRKSDILKPNEFETEEEDACPICLEEYDKENPKLMTKCDHHFHLSCILEWMERSDSCPICDQVWLALAYW